MDPLTHPPVGAPGHPYAPPAIPPWDPQPPVHVAEEHMEERQRVARFVVEVDYFGTIESEGKMALELAAGLRFLAGSPMEAFEIPAPGRQRPDAKFRLGVVNADHTVEIIELHGNGDDKKIGRYRSTMQKAEEMLWAFRRLFGTEG